MKNTIKFTKIGHVYRQLPEISHAGFELILCLISLAILCTSAAAEENTTEYWMNTAIAFSHNGSNKEAISAYDEAIDLNPIYSDAWHGKGEAQSALGLVQDAFESSYVAEKLGYEKE